MSDPEHIYHWRRADVRLTTSGQPSEAELAQIKQLGVTYIVNLGLHEHERALEDETASVTDLGMVYMHIPVAFDAPTDADFERFCAIMDETKDEKVHVHCIANLRVTAFLYRYWRDVLSVGEQDARALMDTVWQPGGVWARFIGDAASENLEHRPPIGAEP